MDYWTKLFLAFVFALLLIPSAVTAQGEDLVKINEFWTGASLNYQLNKKIDFSLDQQVRITDNLNRVRSTFFEFGARYKFNKHFSVRAQHRYIIRNEARHVNRYTLDGMGNYRLKPLKLEFAYRLRMQHAVTTFTKEPETYLRNRFQIRYRGWKRVRPFARYESFYQFNDQSRFRHHLFATGVDFKLSKQLDLSVFYRLDQKINTNNPERRNIIAVLVSFEI